LLEQEESEIGKQWSKTKQKGRIGRKRPPYAVLAEELFFLKAKHFPQERDFQSSPSDRCRLSVGVSFMSEARMGKISV
jgi:hypothetical protein